MSNRIVTVSAWLCSGAVLLSAVNLIFLLFRHSYAFTIGPVHFVAHGLFKPLLLLDGSFLLAVLVKNPRPSSPELSIRVSRLAGAAFLLAVLILHLSLSLRVNPLDDEWNYRLLSSQWRTPGDVAHLFFTGQIASWYRPLGFASLWIDRQLFGEHLWAYHLQNIFLHGLNVVLAFVLSKRLGFTEPTARYAAVLFAVGSVTYEPVMWPSARFDLLAVTFIAFALIAAIDYLRGSGAGAFWITVGCYVLAICSKESAYSFPALAAVVMAIALYRKRDSAEPAAAVRRIFTLSAGILLVTGSMLAMRFAIFGGLGGYMSAVGTRPPDLSFTTATVRSIFARGLPISLLTVNLDDPLPPLLRAVLGGFAVVLSVAAVTGAAVARRQKTSILFALAALAPVVTLLVWLNESAQETRYLYMPSLFIAMLLAAGLSHTRWPGLLVTLLAAASLLVCAYNISVYKLTYDSADKMADQIAADLRASRATRIRISGMPSELNGVLFSRAQLQLRVHQEAPQTSLEFTDAGECNRTLCYVWEPVRQVLTLRP